MHRTLEDSVLLNFGISGIGAIVWSQVQAFGTCPRPPPFSLSCPAWHFSLVAHVLTALGRRSCLLKSSGNAMPWVRPGFQIPFILQHPPSYHKLKLAQTIGPSCDAGCLATSARPEADVGQTQVRFLLDLGPNLARLGIDVGQASV